MREIRPSGSEGGGTETNRSSLPLSTPSNAKLQPQLRVSRPKIGNLACQIQVVAPLQLQLFREHQARIVWFGFLQPKTEAVVASQRGNALHLLAILTREDQAADLMNIGARKGLDAAPFFKSLREVALRLERRLNRGLGERMRSPCTDERAPVCLSHRLRGRQGPVGRITHRIPRDLLSGHAA